MIEQVTETTYCKACGEPLVQAARRGPHSREYCNDTCRQRGKRARDERKAREQQQAAMRERWSGYLPEVQQVLEDVMQLHSVGLAERVTNAIKAAYETDTSLSRNTVAYQEKLAACAKLIEKLERQVEVQKQRLGQYYQSSSAQAARIAELEQELTKYRARDFRAKLEAKFMALGEALQFRALLLVGVIGGSSYWRAFMERADTETLLKATLAAEAFYENLTAPKLEHQQKRIAELEQECKRLRELVDADTLYRMDTKERSFQAWLRRQVPYREGSFSARLLTDKAIPQKGSKAMYIQMLKQLGYSSEDMEIFHDLWIAMIRKS